MRLGARIDRYMHKELPVSLSRYLNKLETIDVKNQL